MYVIRCSGIDGSPSRKRERAAEEKAPRELSSACHADGGGSEGTGDMKRAGIHRRRTRVSIRPRKGERARPGLGEVRNGAVDSIHDVASEGGAGVKPAD